MLALAPRTSPLETPIEIVETKVNATRWDYETQSTVDYIKNKRKINYKE